MTIVGIILILIGLSALTGIPLFNVIFAIVIIVLGIRLVIGHPFSGRAGRWESSAKGWSDQTKHDWRRREQSVSDADSIDEVVVFSPINKAFAGSQFRGGKIVAVFSGAEIDLTGAVAEGPTVDLEISSVFSSVEITIPKNWKVHPSAAVFLGNVDTHQAPDEGGNVTLMIHGEAVFGEIEVRK